jgi:hypothetical protein
MKRWGERNDKRWVAKEMNYYEKKIYNYGWEKKEGKVNVWREREWEEENNANSVVV